MRLHKLVPNIKGIPVLMYHRVVPGKSDRETVDLRSLTSQWEYLRNNNYECLSLERFLSINSGDSVAPERSFLLTFDDGYCETFANVYPLLEKLKWSATFFIIGEKLCAGRRTKSDEFATTEELLKLNPEVASLGMHGFNHENFRKLNSEQTAETLDKMIKTFSGSGLKFHKVLAYPYGSTPGFYKRLAMEKLLKESGIEAAFRIKNKPQKFPAKNPYRFNRIDVRGSDSLEDFIIKLEKGKLHPF
jgi:peptidoglycan/xylan/chitin deacetylase (PgdA/CDA1 family)